MEVAFRFLNRSEVESLLPSTGAQLDTVEQALRAHVHAEIGEIVTGARAGREWPDERILFWHRGFAISDIVLGARILAEAEQRGVGAMLSLLEASGE